jgi:outer membrane receptor protein involved in Fe transport
MRHTRFVSRWPAGSLIALSAVATSPAPAADERPAAAVNSEVIAEIVVTAQKRAQSLQDVPISVTALRGEELELRGAQGLSEFTRLVPGLAYVDFGPGGQRNNRPLIIRGIDAGGNEFASPAVGYYIDEAPISIADTKLFDLDRIEVLRGPQGTLYGVGTAGGTVKLITNQPKLSTFEAVAEATGLYTTHGDSGSRLNGMLNMPLGDEAALRVSAYFRQEPGYIDSVEASAGAPSYVIANTRQAAEENFNDQRVRGVRASLLFQPNGRVSITPSVYLQRNDIGGEPVHAPDAAGDLQIARETRTAQETDFQLYSLTAKFDLGFADLISVTSDQKNLFEGTEDITDVVREVFAFGLPPEFAFVIESGVPFPIRDERTQTTQELRLSSKEGGRLQWLVGAFYQERNSDLFQGSVIPGIDDMTALDIPGDVVAAFDDKLEIREYAGFGEVTFDLTPRLHATGGARYFNIEQETDTTTAGFFFAGGSHQLKSTKEDDVRPKFQLSFDATSDLMLYATASQGFRLGGVAAEVPDTPACRAGLEQLGVSFPVPTGYSADSIWNYEVGSKSSWLDRRLILNASVYYIERTDIVQSTTIPGNCGFSVTQNAGKASSRGAELELSTQLLENLSFDLSVGYVKAQLDSTDPANPEAQAGDRLLQIPEWTVSGAAEYRRPILVNTTGFVRADYQYIGDRPDNFVESDPGYLLPGYGTANLRIGVDREAWSAVLFVDNALDKRPRLSNWSFGHNYGAFHTMQPRTYGITLRWSF